MKYITILGILAAVVLTGCSTTGTFNNEVVCADVGKMRFISFYGPVGIAAKVDTSAVKCPTTEGEKK